MGISVGNATLSIWSNPADKSIEARVIALERNVNRLKQDLDDATKQFEERATNQDAAIAAEHQAR